MCMVCCATDDLSAHDLKLAAIAEAALLGLPTGEDGGNAFPLLEINGGDRGVSAAESNAGGDIAGDSSTTTTVAVGATFDGVLETAGDDDWIAVELEAGQSYTISLSGQALTLGDGTQVSALADPFLYLYGADGQLVGSNDDGGAGLNSALTFTAQDSGTFYISARAWNDAGAGGYRVEVESNALRNYSVDEIAQVLQTGSGSRPQRTFESNTITVNLDGITRPEIVSLAEAALAAWAEVADVTFVATSGAADITFIDSENGAYAQTWTRGGGTIIDRVVVNVASDWNGGSSGLNSYTFQTYLHEIGHALGLAHGGQYNGSATYGVDNEYLNDTWGTTVMSYFNQGEAGFGTARLVLGPQAADIVAIQNLYGTNAATRGGDTVYGFNTTEAGSIFDFQAWADQGIRVPSFSLYDTGGVDVLDLSGFATDQRVSLVVDTWSDIGDQGNGGPLLNVVSIARGTVIEDAVGGAGDDSFVGNAADNRLDGGAGLDTVIYDVALDALAVVDNGDGTFTVTAQGAGTDTLVGIEQLQVAGTVYAIGDLAAAGGATEGNDRIEGTDGDDELSGLGGHDELFGFRGDDVLDGGAGNDLLQGGRGADVLIGGDGIDTADYRTSSSGVTVVLARGQGFRGDAEGDRLESIEIVWGSGFGDVLFLGNEGGNLEGLAGDDVLHGGLGDDFLFGGNGRDRLFAGGGDDLVSGGEGDDILFGRDGNDRLLGGGGYDRIFGGNGRDQIEAQAGNDLVFGEAGNDTVFGGDGVDRLLGGAGDDYLDGGRGNDRLTAGEGDDQLFGGDGVDFLIGDAGNDVLQGQADNDRLLGGAGDDQLTGGAGRDLLQGGADNDTLWGGEDADRLFGDAGNDTLWGEAGADRLYGGAGDDVLDAGIGNDLLIGGAGDDTLRGDDGADRLFADAGADTLDGGAGNDRLFSGEGADVMTGGAGADVFTLLVAPGQGAAADRITDFGDGADRLDLRRLDADSTQSGVQDFTFLGLSDFGGNAGELAVRQTATQTFLEADIDGDGVADWAIAFDGLVDIGRGDLFL